MKILVIHCNALLAGYETETGAELQKKLFQFANDGVLKVFFKIMVVEIEKLQDLGVAEDKIGSDTIFPAQNINLCPGYSLRSFREGSAFIKH